MIPRSLILFSGLPGTGKTTLARQTASYFGVPLFAKDRLQSRLRRQGLAERSTPDGYALILDLADEQLGLGLSTILDAVFPMEGFRRHAAAIARRHQAAFRPVYCFCSDRANWQGRMQSRQQYVPDWTPVGWEEVERLEATFQPWATGSALFLDAADDPESNFQAIVQWIRQPPCLIQK
jgi:predicted kinase